MPGKEPRRAVRDAEIVAGCRPLIAAGEKIKRPGLASGILLVGLCLLVTSLTPNLNGSEELLRAVRIVIAV